MPGARQDDDEVIDLRGEDDDGEFRINRVAEKDMPQEDAPFAENLTKEPSDKVKVKFDKFVNLVATHAYEEIFEKHADEDIVVSTDLLADLANAHEEKHDKKWPVILVIGILLGIGVTWILLKL